MTRRLVIHAAALTEATEAAVWYELEQAGLGARFETALNAALDILETEILPLSSWPGSARLEEMASNISSFDDSLSAS